MFFLPVNELEVNDKCTCPAGFYINENSKFPPGREVKCIFASSLSP